MLTARYKQNFKHIKLLFASFVFACPNQYKYQNLKYIRNSLAWTVFQAFVFCYGHFTFIKKIFFTQII